MKIFRAHLQEKLREERLIYGQETYALKAGDSIYYNSVVPHHVGSGGDQNAEIYAVLYFPN